MSNFEVTRGSIIQKALEEGVLQLAHEQMFCTQGSHSFIVGKAYAAFNGGYICEDCLFSSDILAPGLESGVANAFDDVYMLTASPSQRLYEVLTKFLEDVRQQPPGTIILFLSKNEQNT